MYIHGFHAARLMNDSLGWPTESNIPYSKYVFIFEHRNFVCLYFNWKSETYLYFYSNFGLYMNVFENKTKHIQFLYQQNAKHCLTQSDWHKSQERMFFTRMVG